MISDSKALDTQASFETALSALAGKLCRTNVVLHCAGIIESYNCLSFEKLLIDHEIIGYIKHIAKGFEVNDETLAYDVIKEVGSKGEFLSHGHTFENFRKTFYRPLLSDRQSALTWVDNGSLTIEQRANSKWKKMLNNYVQPDFPADLDADLKKYL